MSKKVQTSKNIVLTHKLINYIVKGKNVPELPENVCFVPFSKNDEKLNEANEELLMSLSGEDKPVVKAEEPKSSKGDWKIIPVNF